jgi:hypothetical protein
MPGYRASWNFAVYPAVAGARFAIPARAVA